MRPGPVHRIVVAGVLAILFIVLVTGFLQMPLAGQISHPAYSRVTLRYISGSTDDTNALNVVNGIITDYRAFDTLGEATVLFISVTSVATVLISSRDRRGEGDE